MSASHSMTPKPPEGRAPLRDAGAHDARADDADNLEGLGRCSRGCSQRGKPRIEAGFLHRLLQEENVDQVLRDLARGHAAEQRRLKIERRRQRQARAFFHGIEHGERRRLAAVARERDLALLGKIIRRRLGVNNAARQALGRQAQREQPWRAPSIRRPARPHPPARPAAPRPPAGAHGLENVFHRGRRATINRGSRRTQPPQPGITPTPTSGRPMTVPGASHWRCASGRPARELEAAAGARASWIAHTTGTFKLASWSSLAVAVLAGNLRRGRAIGHLGQPLQVGAGDENFLLRADDDHCLQRLGGQRRDRRLERGPGRGIEDIGAARRVVKGDPADALGVNGVSNRGRGLLMSHFYWPLDNRSPRGK